MSQTLARGWFALTALVVFTGLIAQLVVTANLTEGHFSTPVERTLNVFCFFTIQSNIIVGVTSLLLALKPHRPSTVFGVFRLDGVLAIAVTGVVFHIALADLHDLEGSAAFADLLLHTISPLMCVISWFLFGPRTPITAPVVGWSLAFPLCWLAFTLVRGAIIDYYPYPFLEAGTLGYPTVAVNSLIVAALFLVLAAGAARLNRLLSTRFARPAI